MERSIDEQLDGVIELPAGECDLEILDGAVEAITRDLIARPALYGIEGTVGDL